MSAKDRAKRARTAAEIGLSPEEIIGEGESALPTRARKSSELKLSVGLLVQHAEAVVESIGQDLANELLKPVTDREGLSRAAQKAQQVVDSGNLFLSNYLEIRDKTRIVKALTEKFRESLIERDQANNPQK